MTSVLFFINVNTFLKDGLSIPFFSVGRHTLTMSRSVVEPPDWLLWVRRAPPQVDADRAAPPESADNTIVSREGSHPPRRVEWQGLLDLTEPEDVNPKRVVRINEVMLCDLFLMHAIFLKHVSL